MRRGFTLIELLVVIAIIAILAAMLFPMFGAAREQGRQTKCTSNLKQLSMAVRQYADDNDGRVPLIGKYHFPNYDNWCGEQQTFGHTYVETGTLFSYTRSRGLYVCPSDIGREAKGLNSGLVPKLVDRKRYPLSYSMNGELHKRTSTSWEPLKLDSLPRGKTTKVLLLIHESRNTINDGLYLWRNNNCDIPDEIHNNGTIASYCDGHARWLGSKELYKRHTNPSEWDPEPSR